MACYSWWYFKPCLLPGSNRLPVWLSHCIDAWKSPLYIFARIHMIMISVYLNAIYTILSLLPFPPNYNLRTFFLYKRMKQSSRIESLTLIDNCDIVWPLWHCLSISQILVRTQVLVVKYVLLIKCKIYTNVV